MGDRQPPYLMRSFSCSHTSIPNNQIKMMQGHDLGGSSVYKKRYVEEAKSYTQPGSVAEKKAFFDAYYKKIAAQKAAADALLEQEKAAAAAANEVTSKVVDLVIDNNKVDASTDSLSVKNLEVFRKERPLLKSKANPEAEVRQPTIKKKPASSSWVASIHHKKDIISTPRAKNVTTHDYTDKRRLAPKSLKVLMNSSFVKESCRKTQSTKPTSSVNSTPKRAVTPMRTPAKAFVNGVDKQPSATLSVNRRIETPAAHPTIVGSKSTGPKWHNLSAVSESLTAYKSKLKSPSISSPFLLRTEDRAARRKQKLEEKFNEKQAQVVQQKARFKEKAETEFRTMRESSYFKALPLPDFYKGREAPDKILEAIQNRSHYEKHSRRF